MTQLFYMILNLSAGGCLVISAVLAARLLLFRGPRKYCYALWSVVLFRLLCPVSFQSAFSLFSLTRTLSYPLPDRFGTAPIQSFDSPAQLPIQMPHIPEQTGSSTFLSPEVIFASVWLTGALALAGYSLIRILTLHHRLHTAKPAADLTAFLSDHLPTRLAPAAVWRADHLETAFVIGFFRPRIYLPAGLDAETEQYILAHESTHLRRCDPLWRLLGFAALCMHWFNPLVWLAWIISGRDMEMSCDEAVVRRLGSGIKKGYSTALLSFAAGRHILPGHPPAFGTGDTEPRIRNVLKYKKPAFWLTAVTAVCMTALCIFLAADPPEHTNAGSIRRTSKKETTAAENSRTKQQKQKTGRKTSGQADSSGNTGSKESSNVRVVWRADLTHDGKPETIRLDRSRLQQDGFADFTVESSDGKTLFSRSLSTSHAGWNTFALYHGRNNMLYLLEYHPYLQQGAGSYSYQLFHLDDSGKILIKDESSVDFSAGMPYTAPDNDIEALIRFTETVNKLWCRSALLVSTDQNVLQNLYDAAGIRIQTSGNYYTADSTQANPLYYIEQMGWTAIAAENGEPAAADDLRTRLEAVNRILKEHREIAQNESAQITR